jgi:hypothetical protein
MAMAQLIESILKDDPKNKLLIIGTLASNLVGSIVSDN